MTRPLVRTQIAFSTGPLDTPVWDDISADVRRINIRRGRQHELDQDEAGQASVLIRNPARKYDPTHTGSPYYPGVKPMRRIRIGSVDPSGDSYIGVGGGVTITTPDSAALSITGDIDIRADVKLTNWNDALEFQTFVAKWTSSTSTSSYWFGAPAGRQLCLQWVSAAGVAYSATSDVLPISSSARIWARAAHTFSGGAGHTTFYYSTDDAETWTQLGSTVDTSVASSTIKDTATSLSVTTYESGYIDSLKGRIYAAQVYSGVGGTLVADFDASLFWVDESGASDTRVVDSVGNVWTTSIDPGTTHGTKYLYSGYILRWPQKWPRKRNAVVELAATDAFHPLNLIKLTTTYGQESSDDRVGAVIDDVGLPAADRVIGAGQSTIVASELSRTPALEHLQHVVLSENGRLYVSASGKVTYIGRWALYSPPYTESQGTFGDASGEMPYLDLVVSYDESQIYNDVQVSIAGSDTYQSASDSDSQDDYFPRTLSRPNLLISATTEAQAAADFLLTRYRSPKLRFEQMVLDGERESSTIWPQIVSRELGDRITVNRRPPGGGSVMTQESYIEGIEHEIAPKHWRTTYDLSPASSDTFGLLDDPILGLPDSTLIPLY